MAPGTKSASDVSNLDQAADPKIYAGQKLQVEYALGKPAARGNVTRVKDELKHGAIRP